MNIFAAAAGGLSQGLTGSDLIVVTTAVLGFLATCFSGVMVYFMARLKQEAELAKVEVKQVAENLAATTITSDAKITATDAKLEAIAVVADATHKLSNSKMGIALQSNMKVWRRLADMTKDESDIAMAEDAAMQYKEHQAQQAKVDAQNPMGIQDASQSHGTGSGG